MSAHARSLPLFDEASAEHSPRPREPLPATSPAPIARPQQRQVWLAIHLRSWSLHAALACIPITERSTLAARAVAVVDDDRRRTVLACNEAALKHGIRAGHSLNAAVALCAETSFLPRNRSQETELLSRLAQQCLAYTPTVGIEAPDELLLEVRGSFRLFGGISALIARVEAELTTADISARISVSPTAPSALWLARTSNCAAVVLPRELRSTLNRLSIAVLRWPLDIELRLRRFGVRSIGDLLRLPRDGLARRIGIERVSELDQAMGRAPILRDQVPQAQRYEHRMVLDFEVETTVPLATALQHALARVDRFLQRRSLTLSEVSFELIHRENKRTPLRIALARPTADMTHVGELLRETLTSLVLEAPVLEVSTRLEHLLPTRETSRDLFEKQSSSALPSDERQARLIEQLRTRLGERGIRALRALADYRPERAQGYRAIDADECSNVSPPSDLPTRPLWLLRKPQAFDVDRGRPFSIVDGPESIEFGWWDGHPVDRAYYVAQSNRGARWWIFRERKQPQHWFLHGVFG